MAKKKIITLVAIVLAIIGGFVALHIVNNMEIEEDVIEAPEPVDRPFILGGDGAESPHVQTVEVHNEHGTFVVVNEDPDAQPQRFTIESFEEYSLQTSRVGAIASSARSLAATDLIYEGGTDFAAFGLHPPSATINIHYVDGTSTVLLIGDSVPGGGGAYAMLEGDTNVYIIPRTAAENFQHRVLDLVDHAITAATEHLPEISTAVLGGSVRPEPIVIESDPVDEDGPMQFHSHLIVSPIINRVSSTRGMEPLAQSFGLRAERIEARFESPEELAAWGLDEPYSTLEITSDVDDSFKLLVSKPDEYGMVYLVREDLPFVYQLDSALLPWLELTFFEMMERMLILPFIDDIASLEIYTPERTVNITLVGEGNDLEVFVNGVLYEAEDGVDSVRNFRTLYQDFLVTSYEAIPEEPMPPDAPILIQFTYHYRDGRPSDVVTIYEGAARRVFVRLNDETPMFGLSSFVDHLMRSIESFLNGEQVVSYF